MNLLTDEHLHLTLGAVMWAWTTLTAVTVATILTVIEIRHGRNKGFIGGFYIDTARFIATWMLILSPVIALGLSVGTP